MPDSGGPPGVGELSRQVREVLTRFEQLVNKLETQFVNKDFFKLYTDGVNRELEHLVKSHAELKQDASKSVDTLERAEKDRNDQLEKRIAQLEGNITWIVRIVIAAIVVAVLAAVGFSKSGGA